MRRRGLSRMFVVQYELRPRSRSPLRRPPPRSLAGLNTHDAPPFADFWAHWREKQPLLRQLSKAGSPVNKEKSGKETAFAILRNLAAGPAKSVQVNPEDLWGERRPHNRPGTVGGGNWRRKAKLSLEQIRSMKEITGALSEIHRLRKGRHDA